MKYFLLVYDRPRGVLLEEPEEFSDHQAALRARLERELRNSRTDVEVVVIGGESVASLVETHARYFRPPAELIG